MPAGFANPAGALMEELFNSQSLVHRDYLQLNAENSVHPPNCVESQYLSALGFGVSAKPPGLRRSYGAAFQGAFVAEFMNNLGLESSLQKRRNYGSKHLFCTGCS